MQSYGAGSWPTVGYSVSCHSRLRLTSLAGSNAKKPSQNQPNQTKPKRSEGNRKDWPETMGNKVVTFTEQELDDYQVSNQSVKTTPKLIHFHVLPYPIPDPPGFQLFLNL